MNLRSAPPYMIVGGLAAALLVVGSYAVFGYWADSLIGLVVTVLILVAIVGGLVLVVLQTVFGIAKEW